MNSVLVLKTVITTTSVENVANYMADIRSTELITIAKESSRNAKDLFKFDLLS